MICGEATVGDLCRFEYLLVSYPEDVGSSTSEALARIYKTMLCIFFKHGKRLWGLRVVLKYFVFSNPLFPTDLSTSVFRTC